jgi:hypothetical protein
MYPIEYMCTKHETIRTGNNIDTVKESKLKLHNMFNDSESIHLKRFKDTGILFKPTSKKATIQSIVVVIIDTHVIICVPVIPILLPKNPEANEDNKGSIIITKYIN